MASEQIVKVTWGERSGYPVSLAEAKKWLRVDTTDDDDQIDILIAAATTHVEKHTHRVFTEEEGVGYLEAFPAGDIILSVPASSIDAVEYKVDGSYVSADLAAYIDVVGTPARIKKPAAGWPSDADTDVPNVVRVTFTAGVELLELAKSAIFSIIAHWYENREAFIDKDGTPDEAKLPAGLDRVIRLLALPTV